MSCEIFKNIELQPLVKLIGKSDVALEILGIIIYTFALFTQSQDFIHDLSETGFTWNFTTLFTDCHFIDGEIKSAVNENRTACEFWPEITGMAASSLGVIIHTLQLLMGLKLIRGAEMRNDVQCHQWVLATVLLTGLEVVINAGQVTFHVKNYEFILAFTAPTLLYKLASCGVVKSFVTEVKRLGPNFTDLVESQPNRPRPKSQSDDQAPLIV